MSAPRLLLDENVTPDLGLALRERGYDALHVADLDLMRVDDEIVFAVAAREGRAVLTQNVRDFMPIASEYAERGEHHAGLIVTPQRSLRELLARALPLLSARSAEDLRDVVLWL